METLATAMKNDRRWKSHSKPSSSSSSSSSSQSSKASLIMAFLSCLAWLYIAGRLWQDADSRMLLSDLLHKNSAKLPRVLTVEDKLMHLGCNEIGRKIVEAEMDLTLARSQGYLLPHNTSERKLLAVVGVYTGFGGRLRRSTFRGSWTPRGDALEKLEQRGVVIRFVIGRRHKGHVSILVLLEVLVVSLTHAHVLIEVIAWIETLMKKIVGQRIS